VTILKVRGRLDPERLEHLRIEVEVACNAGWRVVCDVKEMADGAHPDEQLEDLSVATLGLPGRAGAKLAGRPPTIVPSAMGGT